MTAVSGQEVSAFGYRPVLTIEQPV